MVVVQNLGRNRPPSYTKWADSQLNDDADNDDDYGSCNSLVQHILAGMVCNSHVPQPSSGREPFLVYTGGHSSIDRQVLPRMV